MTKVVLFNVKYSPNLGDGVIAECLENVLRRRGGFDTVTSIDVAGRTEYRAPSNGRRRAQILSLLGSLPAWARDLTVRLALGHALRSKLCPVWRPRLEGADFAIIGGGQLFQDGDLNFPMKLAAAADECQAAGVPLGVYAVGVAKSRSFRGRRLLGTALAASKDTTIAVRDRQSGVNLASYGHIATATCADPGLLASRVWPATAGPSRPHALIGLCITHPSVLNHHATDHSDLTVEEAAHLYTRMIETLSTEGGEVCCFTNGAAEDELMMQIIRGQVAATCPPGVTATYALRSPTPKALAEMIAGFDCVIAHRLHAAIVAVSYGVPVIGLRWDEKLTAFFDSIGLSHQALSFDERTAHTIAATASHAMAERMSDAARASILDGAEADIGRLAAMIHARLGTERGVAAAGGGETRKTA